METVANYDISNISELLIILVFYSVFEFIKYHKKKVESKKYQAQIETEIAEIKQKIETEIAGMKRQTKRLEYLNAVHHFADKEDWIKRLYGEYKAVDGNSYIDEMHAIYLAGIGKKIKKRISNKSKN